MHINLDDGRKILIHFSWTRRTCFEDEGLVISKAALVLVFVVGFGFGEDLDLDFLS